MLDISSVEEVLDKLNSSLLQNIMHNQSRILSIYSTADDDIIDGRETRFSETIMSQYQFCYSEITFC